MIKQQHLTLGLSLLGTLIALSDGITLGMGVISSWEFFGWLSSALLAWCLHFAQRKIDRLEASRLKHIDFLNSRYTSGPAGRIFPRS